MDAFRTELTPQPSQHSITNHHKLLTVGSCFADNIGEKLKANKFPVLINPFGTTYNPLSIHKLLLKAIYNEPPDNHTFLTHEGIHLNYDYHSRFSSLPRQELEASLQEVIGHSHHFIKTVRYVMITYGTAWAYERVDTGEVVANCHKLPSRFFKKFLITQKRILESFHEMHTAMQAFNPEVRFIISVSPVRHLKDTLELNSVSKAVLRLTCHTLAERYQNVDYFPAYELLMDDLRDYRFYDSDLLHPSAGAVDYIWKKFSDCYFNSSTRLLLEQWNQVARAIAHKPFHQQSASHQNFIKATLLTLEELKTKINVDEEIALLRLQLKNP